MLDFYQKHWRRIVDVLLFIATIGVLVYVFTYFMSIATPIFIGFIFFYLIEPFAAFLHRKGIKKSIATSISVGLLILSIAGVLLTLGFVIVYEMQHLIKILPSYMSFFKEQFVEKSVVAQEILKSIHPEVLEKAQQYSGILTKKISAYTSAFTIGLVGAVGSGLAIFVYILMGILLGVMLSLEIEKWRKFKETYIPPAVKHAYTFVKQNVIAGIWAYAKAQLTLIGCTFVIVLVSLLCLRVESALTLSLIAGIFDILPILGVSTLFLPWIAYLIFSGDIELGIWIALVWAVVTTFRQVMEPKVTGDSLGVSPFIILSSMFIFMKILGFAGLILSPIILILGKSLILHGYFEKWIGFPKVSSSAEKEDENDSTP